MNFLDFGGLELYDDLLKSYIDKRMFDYTGDRDSNKIIFTTDASQVTITAKGIGIIEIASEEEVKYISLMEDEYSSTTVKCSKSDQIIIYNANNITALDISNNQIIEIDFLYELPKLEELKVYNNKLDMIFFDKLPNLTDVHIYGNPFVDDCLEDAFTIDNNGNSSPVNTNSDSYKKLNYILSTLDNRVNRGLGSIVLYPWYGLETLIYKADGQHKLCPALDWSSPDNAVAASNCKSGILCKFPRRMRFDTNVFDTVTSPSGSVHIRKPNTKWYFTDEPLNSAIRKYATYSNTSTIPTPTYPRNNTFEGNQGFVLNSVLSSQAELEPYYGVEFRHNGESILYGIVEGYDKTDNHPNPDFPGFENYWNIRYVTYKTSWSLESNSLVFTTPVEKEHVLTRYNKLRISLEKYNTLSHNWVFGSAILDSEDSDGCLQHWKQTGVNRVWETTQKGFRAKIGIYDCINLASPDADHFNVVRYDDAVNSTVATPTALTSTSIKSNSVHGDGCLDNIFSRGLKQVQYKDTDNQIYTMQLKVFGTSPNAIAYFSYSSGNITDMQSMIIFSQHFSYCNLETSSYLIGYNDTNIFNRGVRHHVWGKFGEQNIAMQAAGNDGRATYNWTYFDYNTMPTRYVNFRLVSPYLDLDTILNNTTWYTSESNYLSSLNNLGYNHTCYFGEAISLSNSMEPYSTCYPKNLRVNQVITTAENSGISPRIYLGGYSHILRLRPDTWGVSYFNGTSSATPYVCGTMSLARCLYKVFYPVYKDKSFSTRITSIGTGSIPLNDYDTFTDSNSIPRFEYDNTKEGTVENSDLVNGGYGFYSKFAEYVRDHWMSHNILESGQFQGIGRIDFTMKEPVTYKDEQDSLPILKEISQDQLIVGNKYKAVDNFNLKFVHTVRPPSPAYPMSAYSASTYNILNRSGSYNYNFYRNYFINSKEGYLIPVRPFNNLTSYAISTNQSFGDDISWIRSGSSHENILPDWETLPRTYQYQQVSLSAGIRTLTEPLRSLPLLYNQETDELKVDKRFLKEGDTKRFTCQIVVRMSKDRLTPVPNLETFNILLCNASSRNASNRIFQSRLAFGTLSSGKYYPQNEAFDCRFGDIDTTIYNRSSSSLSHGKSYVLNQSSEPLFHFTNNVTYVFTYVFTGTHIETYVNGELLFRQERLGNDEFWITDFITYLEPTPHNKMKEVRLYDRVLTEDEIISNSIYYLNMEEYNK